MLHTEKWESLVCEVTRAALGFGQVSERGRGTKLRTANSNNWYYFWVESKSSNKLTLLCKSIRTDASLASQLQAILQHTKQNLSNYLYTVQQYTSHVNKFTFNANIIIN